MMRIKRQISVMQRFLPLFVLSLMAGLPYGVGCGPAYEPLHAPPQCIAGEDPRCPGSRAPRLQLEDVNPQSPGFSERRNFATWDGGIRVTAVLAGW